MEMMLGAKLRELREQRDISLRELARRVDTSAAHISDIELGRRFPSDELLEKIAAVLSVPVEELEKYDHRAPIEELRRLAHSNPAFGFAFRRMIDEGVTPEELIQLVNQRIDQPREPS
jgi:transcriptional regulator with XRE-family HTH domain